MRGAIGIHSGLMGVERCREPQSQLFSPYYKSTMPVHTQISGLTR